MYNGIKQRTFIVQILSEQDETVKGVVTWAQGNQRRSFRSMMELMRLVESTHSMDSNEDNAMDIAN